MYNYGRSIAQIALHFRKLPLELSDQSINEYLLELKAEKNPSESYLKHTVYELRYLFRLFEREDRTISLPPIKRSKKLPVVLNRQEVLTSYGLLFRTSWQTLKAFADDPKFLGAKSGMTAVLHNWKKI